MPKYRVYLSETNTYSIDVEATDEQDARELGREALCNASKLEEDIEDLSGFSVIDATEIIDDD